jgi:4-hydroxymandelate oxidase
VLAQDLSDRLPLPPPLHIPVFKALANGANAVLIGRPYLHGLAVAGAAGVARVVRILEREFAITMAMMGRTSISGIDRDALWDFNP